MSVIVFKRYNRGPKTEPCSTPDASSLEFHCTNEGRILRLRSNVTKFV